MTHNNPTKPPLPGVYIRLSDGAAITVTRKRSRAYCHHKQSKWQIRPAAFWARYRQPTAADVLTDGRHLPLQGQERLDAITAMHHLGWRPERMQEALCIEARHHLYRVARDAGIEMVEPDEVDELAVQFITQGTRMRLSGATRRAAIRSLADRYTAREIAYLMFEDSPDAIQRVAYEERIPLTAHETTRWRRPPLTIRPESVAA